MRSIKDLLKENSKVWFYFSNELYGKRFIEEARTLGIHIHDGIPVENAGILLGVDSNLKAGRVSMMVWECSFYSESIFLCPPTKVDYGKYISGEEDYLITENMFFRS